MPTHHLKYIIVCLAACTLLPGCASSSATSQPDQTFSSLAAPQLPDYSKNQDPASYQIHPGDLVDILLPSNPGSRHEDLSKVWPDPAGFEIIDGETYTRSRVPVSPTGEIHLPIIGNVKIASQTPEQATRIVLQKMGRYYKKPRFFMRVAEYSGYDQLNRIAVMGEVFRAGVFPFFLKTNLLEALSFAEGYKSSAQLDCVIVIRNGYSDNPQFIKVNVTEMLNGTNLTNHLELLGGDIVYVPKSWIASVGEFIQFYFSNVRPIADTYISYYDAINASD